VLYLIIKTQNYAKMKLFKLLHKKAAMFGLDARIALAIFAALSVISGAALYKVMEQVKVAKYQNFFEELIKASEQYYLDNGQMLPQQDISPDLVAVGDLINNRQNLDTWKGPYIDSVGLSGNVLNIYSKVELLGVQAWGSIHLKQISPGITNCTVGSTDCAEYIRFNLDDADEVAWGQEVFRLLDAAIDNNDGYTEGRVRYVESSPILQYIFYQGLPHIKRL
jgi:hypothetical protein